MITIVNSPVPGSIPEALIKHDPQLSKIVRIDAGISSN